MKLPNLLALPPSILALLIAADPQPEPQWPHNLPKHLKYFPEEEHHVKRSLEVEEKLRRHEKPVGVRKMSAADEGEMFMLGDWIFPSDIKERDASSLRNATLAVEKSSFDSPLRPHVEDDYFARFRVRDILLKRDFKCPSGTTSCTSIGAPNSCCGTNQTCIDIQDTGFGAIGCCGQGQSCQGSISCNTANGYTSCPNSPNGGCCLPGYSCQDVGCVVSGTTITYIQPSSSSPPASSPASATSVVVVPTTTSSTITSSTSAYTCSTGWFSCAASLGGGCCQNGRTCATGASCLGSDAAPSTTASTTAAPSAPVRPTGGSGSSDPSSTLGEATCPVGFYACQAYYPSGCCRIGRDCQTTGSCALPTPSTTVVNSNGVTIVGPSGAGFATTAAGQEGSCPSAWYSCPASRGGNCCPQGYACGEQCSATSGTSVTGKVAPSQATIPGVWPIWGMAISAVAVGVAMVLL
ncbi:hypothetical protein P280DRAFT_473479 [Massarina eburnea CBS 473.64]|uniref:GPI anchored protein n=1 Tax=Massarina eburnea CBS 473.64 TaxID=1395130 RepID=A0A6A6RKD4_9PLEO|nr:hypothetical protein P280DRAFT_473479 [Massarina eburnea CBS 473.64]